MSRDRSVLLRSTLGLSAFAALTVGLVAVTQVLTAPAIARNQAELERAALARVLPVAPDPAAAAPPAVTVPGAPLGLRREALVHRVGDPDRVRAIALPARAPDGYSGAIDLLVGVDAEGRVTGVEVTQHRETPGLGDKIERRKSDWIRGFEGRALGDPPAERWTVAPDGGAFDALTGATITPRAVVAAVRRTLEFVRARRQALFDPGTTELEAMPQPTTAAAAQERGDTRS